ncbi:MAG TPA: VWA-like domain-containing protein [Vicinamibacterales bacterium]|nr:VWA-like domain-containing protein [Vicinamibacterales bacterium]
MKFTFRDLIRRSNQDADGYSRALQAARVRAAYQRSYFAPALFNLIPVATDLIDSMAVDAHWRLYYNDTWLARHTVEENATLLIHEVGHLLRDHEARKKAAGITDHRRWNTAGDCEINDDLHAEGLPLPGDPPLPAKYGLKSGDTAEVYYKQLSTRASAASEPRERSGPAKRPARERVGESEGRSPSDKEDCGSGAHGERRFWELPADDDGEGGTPGVDRLKAELVRREVARRIDEISPYAGEVSPAWRRWARATLAPKVDYLATIRHVVRRALRESTLGRYDRTYRRPHRRQACYGELLMPSFQQPRPRPGFLIDTSSSMEDSQLARALAELAGLTRQLGYGADVVVACCDAAVRDVRKVFGAGQVELYGGGGTDLDVGLRAFIERTHDPIDLLVIVSDCHTTWSNDVPPFPVITIRVGDGAPPPWGNRGGNRVISIEDRRG